ncbi:hypothetical protein C2G38_2218853 [Gigaspora rosea]|uniref:Uncharacterized protein n=1 Tax=Gigaspora rosea TaxID=44941 RepID=A0A397U610_9GLOM|nr:hypothetical protein C2G38_2218853 [Gigaspora rosea]
MVKASIILISLILILQIHLTTTLPAHVLEGHNLTMLPANISGHKLEKRGKKIIIRRPVNLPASVARFSSMRECSRAQQAITFSICCALFGRNTVIDEPQRFQLSFWSRLKLFFYGLSQQRLLPDVRSRRQDSLFLLPNNPLNLKGSGETRVQGPDFVSAVDLLAKYNKMKHSLPYCLERGFLPAIPVVHEEKDLCLPHNMDDMIRSPDPITPIPEIDSLSMARFYDLFAFYSDLDDRTINVIWYYYTQMQENYISMRRFLHEIKRWAISLGQAIREYRQRNRQYEKGETSNARRFMCDEDDDDNGYDGHDELRK